VPYWVTDKIGGTQRGYGSLILWSVGQKEGGSLYANFNYR